MRCVHPSCVCISRWTSRVGLQSLFLESTNYWTPNWGLKAHLVRHFIFILPKTNQTDLQLMSTCFTVRLITSVSSCTSSIVGHGSAICARGIFAGFFRVPPQRLGFGLPRCWCRSCQVQLTEQLLHSAPKSSSRRFISTWLSSLGEGDAHADAAGFTNKYNPLIWLRRRWSLV